MDKLYYSKESPYYDFKEKNEIRYESFKKELEELLEKYNVIFAKYDEKLKCTFKDTLINEDYNKMFVSYGYSNGYYFEDLIRNRIKYIPKTYDYEF